MLRVAAQERFFLSRKQVTEHLSYTQKTELVKLPDDDEKIKLVKKFQKEGTSTKKAAELIAGKRKVVRRPRLLPNPPNPEAHEMSHEQLRSPVRASGLKGLLSLPVASIHILDQDILQVLNHKAIFAVEWHGLDDDQRNQLIDKACKSLEIHVRVLDAYEWLDTLIKALPDSE